MLNAISENAGFDVSSSLESIRRGIEDNPFATPVRENALFEQLTVTVRDLVDQPCWLAFSGGVDSALLLAASQGEEILAGLITLSAVGARRDIVMARRAAASLGMPLRELIVGEEDVREVISEYKGTLAELPDYTQRILAVCELLIANDSMLENDMLMTGHGPELFLGGFVRRNAPTANNVTEILDRARLNLERLDLVARSSRRRIILPYVSARMSRVLYGWLREGKIKQDLSRLLPANLKTSGKSSLQNGSGIHYLFVKMARNSGAARARDFMEKLIS